MRLSFFDPPRRGELLYSALARYGRWKGIASPKAMMFELFGRSSTIAAHDLPNSLAELFTRAPSIAGSIDEIIGRNTLFGYYTAFQPAERIDVARRAVLGSTKGLRLLLGVSTFRTGRPDHLQFCPECLDLMELEYGSIHWRADHQLPGVLVCPTHACRLRRSLVALASVNRHAFVMADRSLCGPHSEPVTGVLSPRSSDLAFKVAKSSSSLLVPDHAGRTRDQLLDIYRGKLAQAGLIRGHRTVDQAGLRQAFEQHFGELLNRFCGVELDCKVESWLNSLVRSRSGAHPPLHHILLSIFLDDAARQASTPAGGTPIVPSTPVIRQSAPDWRNIDLRYASVIRRRGEELLRSSPPVRVTAASIERGLGKRDWLIKRRAKLPLASQALTETVDTTETFRLRRLRWHICRCLADGEFDPWVILRRAGLPHSYADKVRSELDASRHRQSLRHSA